MWGLENNTPFAAERSWVRDENGAEVWLVAIRATFDVDENGHLKPAKTQVPVVLGPTFSGEPGKSSLLHDTDMVHTKLATDVLVLGNAITQNNQPCYKMQVRLQLATIDKSLMVFGSRVYQHQHNFELSAPILFTEQSLMYEYAYGGVEINPVQSDQPETNAYNPIGCGLIKRLDNLHEDIAAPRVEDFTQLSKHWDHPTNAIGLGPIGRHWQPRLSYAGTYDANWQKTRAPLLPADFDRRFHQCAPPDQQIVGFLNGGEYAQVTGMTATGLFRFRVPRVSFALRTLFTDDTVQNHRADLHTLIIEPNQRRIQVVWHSALPCHPRVNKLETTLINIKPHIGQVSPEPDLWKGEI